VATAGASATLELRGLGEASVSTGVSALDHLLAVLTRYARFGLTLDVAPGEGRAEVEAAGTALGEALAPALRAPGARGCGSASLPSDEALAHVALDVSEQARLVSNVDLSEARIGGVGSDVAAAFLRALARAAGLTLHVRLIGGEDPQHVLEAIFKALGVALAQACRTTATREDR
jgi:imidazoleglycerol-phosphate dehydratase